LLERFLTQEGFRVDTAAYARDALDRLDRPDSLPDLILSDFSLTGMDGAQLLKIIRTRRTYLPVIFLSGLHPETVLRHCEEKPDAVLKKPVALAQLKETVLDLLK
jgi:DNA-binding response OmpR family regulator